MTTVISTDLVTGAVSTTQPLTYARIGYQKITGTITASTSVTGFPASAANNPLTATFWKPSVLPASWELDAAGATDVNYIAIAAHTFGTDGTTCLSQYWDGAAWQDLEEVTPSDDSPILFIFDDQTATKYRIYLTGSTTPRVGVVYIGKLLEMQRSIYAGHTPITLTRRTEYKTNISENGQWLGRSIVRGGSNTSYSWSNLTPSWYRANFDPFVEAARTTPFFIAWNPSDYPDEVGYVWTTSDIEPANSGTRGFMDVSMKVEGLAVE